MTIINYNMIKDIIEEIISEVETENEVETKKKKVYLNSLHEAYEVIEEKIQA